MFKKNCRLYQLPFLIYVLCLTENFIIRTVLTVKEFDSFQNPAMDLLKVYFYGWYHDTLFFAYFLVPLLLYFLVLPNAALRSSYSKRFLHIATFVIIVIFAFQAHAEWFFWMEFNARFNFIAVDYLVYTQEVIGNIVESYPMYLVYTSILVSAYVIYRLFRSRINQSLEALPELSRRERSVGFAVLALAPFLSFTLAATTEKRISENRIVDELSRNGFYQFVSAFRKNELDYYSFYQTLDEREMIRLMKKEMASFNSHLADEMSPEPVRVIVNEGEEKKYNVVFITVESLSASFMGMFEPHYNATPYLDALANQSMFFTQMYATGLRTVRGLEAITLSIPPTPGYSIVKRPKNENLFSLGSIFKSKGYDTKFLYGGYGYFDNMNYFFEQNGFKAIDRTDFADSEIEFANIWGICDENLLTRALKEADTSHARGQPFFEFVLTTSNHRPYTYPEGRIDIPSKTGRVGAVKYTDYAIGTFIEKARKKPWFDDTIFVVIADHCAGGRGQTSIPLQNYHIPAIIYAPKIIQPQVVSKIVSQIDIGPTLLGLMNFSYNSKFFGKDALREPEEQGRLVLGTYQNLGYFRDGQLITLSPNQQVDFERVNVQDYSYKTEKTPPNPELLAEAISYYQYSNYLLKNNLYRILTPPGRS